MGLPLSLLGGEGRPSKRALMKSAFTLSPAMLMPCFFIISFRSLFTLPDSSSRVKKGLGGGGGGGAATTTTPPAFAGVVAAAAAARRVMYPTAGTAASV